MQVVKRIINVPGKVGPIYDRLIAIPTCKWTEEMVLEVLKFLTTHGMSQYYYKTLFAHIPTSCLTYKIWRDISAGCPALMRQVPTGVATQSFYEDVVRLNSRALIEVPRHHRTIKLCSIAAKYSNTDNNFTLEHVPYESQTEEMILAAIDAQGGHELRVAAFQTREICMKAIKNDPKSIKWVNDQTPEICETAIQSAGLYGEDGVREVLASIRIHTLEVCINGVHQMENVLEYLRNQQPEVCLAAIKYSSRMNVGRTLSDVREQTLEVCISAYRKERDSYRSIRDNVMRRRVARLILASDALIPLHSACLSTSLLTEVCEILQVAKFALMIWSNTQLLTPVHMWALAAKVKHAK